MTKLENLKNFLIDRLYWHSHNQNNLYTLEIKIEKKDYFIAQFS